MDAHQELLRHAGSWSTPANSTYGGISPVLGQDGEVNVGSFDCGDDRYSIATLTLGIVYTSGVRVVPPVQGWVRARITVGVGTTTQTFYVDWAHGTSIVVPTGGGKVSVYAQQAFAISAIRVALTCSCVPGTRGVTHRPQYTELVQISAGGTAAYAPPPRAVSLLVPRTAVPSDLTVKLIGVSHAIALYDQASAADAPLWTTGVALPNICTGIVLASTNGTPANWYQPVIFGIDG
jgi:hypothetical protein